MHKHNLTISKSLFRTKTGKQNKQKKKKRKRGIKNKNGRKLMVFKGVIVSTTG